VTSEDLDQAIANFNRWKQMGQEIPVDYDHAFSEGREAPAAGWYASLERRGDALWATVRWTAKAREEIASGQYRFFSPEFAREWKSETGDAEGFTIVAGALTNRPFLRGMTPVALNQEVDAEIVAFAIDALEAAAPEQRKGVADTSAEVAEKNDKPEVETFKVEIDGEEKELTADEVVALHAKAADADAAEAKAKEKEAEAKAAGKNVETLSTRIETLEEDAKERDFKELFTDVGLRPGRFKAGEESEKTWRETFDALGKEKTKALMEQVPPETIPLSQQGRAGSSEQEAVPDGVAVESFKLNQKVEAYMAEHPDVDFNAALDTVRGQMSAAGDS
jgi:phage I-like protein